MDVPHTLTRPLLVRSTFLLRAPAAFPLSLTISNRPRSNGHATRSLFRIPAFEAAALLPPLLFPRSFSPASLLPSCVLPGVLSRRDDAKIAPRCHPSPGTACAYRLFPWHLMNSHSRNKRCRPAVLFPVGSSSRLCLASAFRASLCLLRIFFASPAKLRPHRHALVPQASPYAKGPPA